MTPKRIYDFAWERPSPDALAALGTVGVSRYLGYDTTGKNLTRAEAERYAAVGIAVWSNFEYDTHGPLRGARQGTPDALISVEQHLACGGTVTAPILYSVDFDLPDYAPTLPNDSDPENARAKLGPVADYFDAVQAVHAGQPVGAYGGYWAIKRLFDAGLISDALHAYAWSGGQWDSRAKLRQVANGVGDVPGMRLDRGELWADDPLAAGAWFPAGVVPSPPPPQPARLLVDGKLGPLTISAWQRRMGTPVDGKISTPSVLVTAVQRYLNARINAGLRIDGIGIVQDGHTRYETTRALQRYLATTQDGVLSLPVSDCVRALQQRLNAGTF